MSVLLVSHDGARFLPRVLSDLAAQTVPPSAVVAVDTGSRDDSVRLLTAATPRVVTLPRSSTYAAAVRAGLAEIPPDPGAWVWLLHDDSAPAADALERLLAWVEDHPDSTVLGPKLREWPSLRRLLEVGVTVSGGGRRETGLERGEYDSGQHDEPRAALAVNTAGMLVRRDVLDSLGFDDALPVVGADLDFGWRANRAGHRVQVVPHAVVFHAEASVHGIRDGTRGRAGRRRRDREAALHLLLANAAAPWVPLVVLRQLLGGLSRALALLLVRAPRESLAELQALGAVLLRPGRLLAARRARRSSAVLPARSVRPLLPPPWLPLRHGLDELAGIGAAAAAAVRGPVEGPSAGRRLRGSPGAWVVLALLVLALVAGPVGWGRGTLFGGALLPAPDGAGAWWSAYLERTHDLATGSTRPAPAYLLPLAVLATLLLGSARLAVDLLVVGVAPLAAWGAYRFLLPLTRDRWSAAWGAATYAVLPVLVGAVAQGRLGTLAATVLLPWLAGSARGLLAPSLQRRRQAAWRTSLWLAAVAAFVPLAWLVALVLTLVAVGVLAVHGVGRGKDAGLDADRWVPLLLPVPVSAVLCLPWSALVWSGAPGDGVRSVLLGEAGLPAPGLAAAAAPLGVGPVWVLLLLAVSAAAALVPGRTRPQVLVAWLVSLVGLAGLRLLAGAEVDLRGGGAAPVWTGGLLVLTAGAWVGAVAAGLGGVRPRSRPGSGTQAAAALVCAGALVVPLAGALWWVALAADGPVRRGDPAAGVPAYVDDAAERDPAAGALVLTGTADAGYEVAIRRDHGLTVGEDEMLPVAGDLAVLTATATDLLTGARTLTSADLAALGVMFVLAPGPVDPDLAGRLDAAPQLAASSAGETDGRVWRVATATGAAAASTALPDPEDLPGARLRPLLLTVQALALVSVAVLAAPGRERHR